MDTSHRHCLACDSRLLRIQIIDRGHTVQYPGFAYTSPGAKRGFWSGSFPEKGQILAFACSECGAVRLFAESHGSG